MNAEFHCLFLAAQASTVQPVLRRVHVVLDIAKELQGTCLTSGDLFTRITAAFTIDEGDIEMIFQVTSRTDGVLLRRVLARGRGRRLSGT